MLGSQMTVQIVSSFVRLDTEGMWTWEIGRRIGIMCLLVPAKGIVSYTSSRAPLLLDKA